MKKKDSYHTQYHVLDFLPLEREFMGNSGNTPGNFPGENQTGNGAI